MGTPYEMAVAVQSVVAFFATVESDKPPSVYEIERVEDVRLDGTPCSYLVAYCLSNTPGYETFNLQGDYADEMRDHSWWAGPVGEATT